MKILAMIDDVYVKSKFQQHDGTCRNVYRVTLVTGDDNIISERWRNEAIYLTTKN